MPRKSKSKARVKTPQNKQPTSATEAVSSTKLAAILSASPLSERVMRELLEKGYIVKNRCGEYDLSVSVQGYVRFLHETELAQSTDENIVSTAKLGAILGLGDRWMRELAEKGYLVKTGRGEWKLPASVQGYQRFIRETEVEKQLGDRNARAEFETERARKLKLDNDEKENLLISTALAVSAVDFIVGDLRTNLAAVPAKVSDDVVERRHIESVIDDVLEAIADRFQRAADLLGQGRDPFDEAAH